MISPENFYNALSLQGVNFFAGVPDSLLKEFCAYITDNVSAKKHILAANEGGAVGLAVGHHLATGKVPVVYMQNSGLGNTINPLLSIADTDVYSIPMLLVIGWRGEPGVKDEPQHVKQGELTLPTLDVLGVDYIVIDQNTTDIEKCVARLHSQALELSKPMAIVVKKGTFSAFKGKTKESTEKVFGLSREDTIKVIVDHLGNDDFVVSTTGMASRELFEYRKMKQQAHSNDFLTVGGMGHASQIATGIALSRSDKNVICIDGDGAALMHLGSLAISAQTELKNFKHIIINNGAHDSVGGQPTVCQKIDLSTIAKACGYNVIDSINNCSSDLSRAIDQLNKVDGPALLEVFVDRGNRKDLGRPTTTPIENKQAFMDKLKRN
ncbi:phosphonopyruvate decarboxylase [Vibrio cortegadensis]|uniref:phosphonopyruvate decarboxylase n=1 Tax=Vibrio cortegadensis TaxID=1328770 RepID=UPI0021C3B972|nr:phosphonopyruvate decarboxylase [Vibrio cortegadensis]MDN3697703.1 phosphonopyruvate decarboxylase [Vibrio cortegadensis]